MRTRDNLFLHEEVLLLALRDREGTNESGVWLDKALGGAILAELLLSGRLEVERDKKKRFARVVNPDPLGDPVLDECLQRVVAAKKRQQLQTWVTRFANMKGLKRRVARGLCRMGVLREDEGTVLKIFRRIIYPEVDPGPERRIVARLEEAVFGDGPIDPRTMVLVAIAQAGNLLKVHFDKKRLKTRKQRLKDVVAGEAAGSATAQAVAAAQAAAAMTVIIASTVATSAATS